MIEELEKFFTEETFDGEEMLSSFEGKVEMLLWWVRGVRKLTNSKITPDEAKLLSVITIILEKLEVERVIPFIMAEPDVSIMREDYLLQQVMKHVNIYT